MELKQLQYFVSVFQTQNFTQSAREFFITQPALSRSINALEAELGVKLFSRGPHYVKATPEGCAYYQHAINVIKAARAGEDKLRLMTTNNEIIRVSTIPSLQEQAVAILSEYHENNPDIQILIDVSTGLEQILALSESRFDVYLSYQTLLTSNSTLNTYELRSEQLCMFLPEKYLSIFDPNNFSSLSGKKFILERRYNGPYIASMLQSVCAIRGLDCGKNILHLNNLASVCMAVSAGIGYTVNPMSISKAYYMGNVVTIPITGEDATINYAIGINNNRKTPAIDSFLSLANRRLRKTPAK